MIRYKTSFLQKDNLYMTLSDSSLKWGLYSCCLWSPGASDAISSSWKGSGKLLDTDSLWHPARTPFAKTIELHCKLKVASYCLLNEINWSNMNVGLGVIEVHFLCIAIQVWLGCMVATTRGRCCPLSSILMQYIKSKCKQKSVWERQSWGRHL